MNAIVTLSPGFQMYLCHERNQIICVGFSLQGASDARSFTTVVGVG